MIYKYGIDFGTTNSSIAIRFADENNIEHTILPKLKDSYPYETVPSLICICDDGNIYVGLDAKYEYYKRCAEGKKVKLIKEIKMSLEKEGRELKFSVGAFSFTGVELIAEILKYLRQRIEKEISFQDIKASGVVMGVPVQYGDIQKDMLKEALVKAGFYDSLIEAENKTEFASEPVAVAVHYGLKTTDNKKVMVFDFGGGTLDIAIVNLKDQIGIDHLHPHDVISKGRMTLGGEKLTKQFFINTFCGSNGYGTRKICEAFHFDRNLSPDELWSRLGQDYNGAKLQDDIDMCKCELSTNDKAKFVFIGVGVNLPEKKIYRDYFEEAIEEYLGSINDFIDHCLSDGGIQDKYEIDHVIISGGSSLIPSVQELLRTKFGAKKVATNPGGINAAPKGNWNNQITEGEVLTSIVRGLAAIGCRKEAIVEDVVDNDYGLWDDGKQEFLPIIMKDTPIKIASKFDKVFGEGTYIPIKPQYEDQTTMTISIYQRNVAGEEKLGSIFIENVEGSKYKAYMYVDAKQGKLVVELYDIIKKHWIKIPLNQSQYDIKK